MRFIRGLRGRFHFVRTAMFIMFHIRDITICVKFSSDASVCERKGEIPKGYMARRANQNPMLASGSWKMLSPLISDIRKVQSKGPSKPLGCAVSEDTWGHSQQLQHGMLR